MPNKPARPCSVAACPNLVQGEIPYCPKHKHLAPTGWGAKKDLPRQKFYHRKRWRKLSALYRKSNPVCVQCAKQGRTVPADVVDHITPILDGGDPYDEDNLQSLCNSCHNSKTAKENARRK